MNSSIDDLIKRFNPSPYQIYVLKQNGYKYALDKIKKYGDTIYAPRRCEVPDSFADSIKKLFFGSRADLIGIDRMIAVDESRINQNKILSDYK